MSADIIEFPEPTEREITKEQVADLHSKAFRGMENHVCECVLMANIAMQLIEPLIGGLDSGNEEAFFALGKTVRMLRKLKTDYYAAWHGEIELDAQ
jgi:hypothetical protein